MIEVITRARVGYAEVIRHSGKDACRVGGEEYEDNSRNSVVCKTHRKEYQKQQRNRNRKGQNAIQTSSQTIKE